MVPSGLPSLSSLMTGTVQIAAAKIQEEGKKAVGGYGAASGPKGPGYSVAARSDSRIPHIPRKESRHAVHVVSRIPTAHK